MQNQLGKNFINILEHIKPSKHAYEVFSDWLVLSAAVLYIWKGDENINKEYSETAKDYPEDELLKMGELLDITVNALEEKEQDFLGEIFIDARLSNAKTGQFFTPYHVSYMSALATMGECEFPKGRVCKINDPACGAGGMLIAGLQVMKEKNFNYQQNAFFIAQDIDARCARMSYIQLSLLGAPAVVYCMNTLTGQEYWHRETIGYHLSGMEYRLRTEQLIDNVKSFNQEEIEESEQIQIEETSPISIIQSSEKRCELVQGELF